MNKQTRADRMIEFAEIVGDSDPTFGLAREAGVLREQIRTLCVELEPDAMPETIRNLGTVRVDQIRELLIGIEDLCRLQPLDYSDVIDKLQEAIEEVADVWAPTPEDAIEFYEAQRVDEAIDEAKERRAA